MVKPTTYKIAIPIFLWLALFSLDVNAAIIGNGVFDTVLSKYQSAAAGWSGYIISRASWLYWTLVVISMIWTFGMMALRKADIGEFFAEFTKFTITTGFFWWLLTNGPNFATSIYGSMRQIGANAGGLSDTISPSGIVDVGFLIFNSVLDNSTVWSPVDSVVGVLLALAILIVLALIGVNMLLLLVSGWILAYAGVFFLGFGGSRWTSDMAIHYYKTVLGIGAQLMTMILLVGIGKTFVDDYYNHMTQGTNLKELGVMMIVAVILLMLVNKVPVLISGITGAGAGHSGIGQFGAGAALGAAGMAAAAAATGGAMLAASASNIGGGAQAIMAAVSKANENVHGGTDVLSSMMGGNSDQSQSGGGSSGSPLAQAAGFGSPAGGSSGGGGGDVGGKAGQGSQAGSFLAATGKMAADTVANLASGTASVAKDKASGMWEDAKASMAETTGGKIAAAIGSMGGNESPSFVGDNLGGDSVDAQAEVSAFVNQRA